MMRVLVLSCLFFSACLWAQQAGSGPDATDTLLTDTTSQPIAARSNSALPTTTEPQREVPHVFGIPLDMPSVILLLITVFTALFFIYRERTKARIAREEQVKAERELAELRVLQAEKIAEAELRAQQRADEEQAPFIIEQTRQLEMARLSAASEHSERERRGLSDSAQDRYRALLYEKLGSIQLLGHEELDDVPVSLEDAFVSLRVSHEFRSDKFSEERSRVDQDDLEPLGLMHEAVRQKERLVLIVGDPGSGKTTLMKHFALCAMHEHKCRDMGYSRPVLPLYLPLLEMQVVAKTHSDFLIDQLSEWARQHHGDLTPEVLQNWLNTGDTLVLLDGLDEISDKRQRQQACRVIENLVSGYPRTRVVVTTRWAGYGRLEKVELATPPPLRADVKDMSFDEQQCFLRRWFYAVRKRKKYGQAKVDQATQASLEEAAATDAAPIIAYLEHNDTVRKLVEVPVLLQILAVVWMQRGYKASSRSSLYRAALSYLLADRDDQRGIAVALSADESLRMLKPLALLMQEGEKLALPREEIETALQEQLKTLDDPPDGSTFCEFLRTRAGLFNHYRKNELIWRHKSFMEYLAGLRLSEENSSGERLAELAGYVKNDWWSETLKFYLSESTTEKVDLFMQSYLRHPDSDQLTRGNNREYMLLLELLREAPQKTAAPFIAALQNMPSVQKAIVLIDCLEELKKDAGFDALETLLQQDDQPPEVVRRISEVLRRSGRSVASAEPAVAEVIEDGNTVGSEAGAGSVVILNPWELDAEYLGIPGGSFHYSVSKSEETVPQRWLARYPLSNSLYRRFIVYLQGGESALQQRLPQADFLKQLADFAATIDGYAAELGKANGDLAKFFRSGRDEDKRFGGDNQPVVSISWYAARSYCFWQSLLALEADQRSLQQAAELYRLPRDVEWEWAAAGRAPGGGLREYPWPAERGKPSEKLANYGNNVGQTTPVGSYADGATPEGLLDMAGNVLEWMEDYPEKGKNRRSLRGGSWVNPDAYLRCSARAYLYPENHRRLNGFRILLSRSL